MKSSYSFEAKRLLQKLGGSDFKGSGKALHDLNGRVTVPALDSTHIGTVDARPVGIILLAPAARLAKRTDVPAEASTYFHARPETRTQRHDLQTMSNNAVDFVPDTRLPLVADE